MHADSAARPPLSGWMPKENAWALFVASGTFSPVHCSQPLMFLPGLHPKYRCFKWRDSHRVFGMLAQSQTTRMKQAMRPVLSLAILVASTACLAASPFFTVDATRSAGKVSPRLYGLMTEEINHAYDGGLYAELISNRAFLDDAQSPVNWSVVKDEASTATIALDPANPLNDKLPTSVRLTVTQATKDHLAGVANSGYWGIPVQPKTEYPASLWARAEAGFSGPLTVSIVS